MILRRCVQGSVIKNNISRNIGIPIWRIYRCFSVGVVSTAVPRGMMAFPLPDSDKTVEEIAEAYVNMDLVTMRKFHELSLKATSLPPNTSLPSYEEILLQGMGAEMTSNSMTISTVSGASSTPTDSSTSAEAPPVKKAVEKNVFDVNLKKYPAANKVKLIKELRAVSSIPLQEAKAAVEKCPGVVVKSMTRADAEKLKKLFEGHGAEVELL